MKHLSREFTTREKILLLILALLLVVVVYYYLVDIPLRSEKDSLTSQLDQLNTDYQITHAKYEEYMRMKADMEKVTEDTSVMASYNNRSEELAFLDDLFKNTLQYSVGFSPVTVEGDQIRRDFTVSFTARSYEQATAILGRLADCHLRCIVNDISCSGNGETALNGAVTVSCGATFYETMVDRNTDAGLPVIETPPVENDATAEPVQ